MLLLLLLSIILFYVHLAILNKVDLILAKSVVSIRCPDGKISFVGKLPISEQIDDYRGYCSNPYIAPLDDSINVFTTNALLHKCIDEHNLETKFKLHLTRIHKSGSITPSSILIYNENSTSKKKLKSESFFNNNNYTVTVAENIKLINVGKGKFRYTFYIWFVKRDWILCRLDIDFDSHPCHHKFDSPSAVFNPFCYYNSQATKSMTIDELNNQYDWYMKNESNKTSTSHPKSTKKNLIINTKKSTKKSKKQSLIKKHEKKSKSSLTFLQANLTPIIIVSIICLLILFSLLFVVFYCKKRKENEDEQELVKQSSMESIISTIDDHTIFDNALSKNDKKSSNALNIRSNFFDDMQ